MSTANSGKLISEMNSSLNDAEVLTDTISENELPFESLDDFSTDPLGFNELALKMLNKVEGVFDLAVKYNRHSSRYLQCCAHLEKGIKYLGSACLTKIVLQKQKHSFPDLGQLSTEKLYRMASFHFRKLDAALTEYQQKHHEMNDALLDMQFRYFNLLQRLCATEERIYKYNEQSYTSLNPDYSPVVRGLAFSDKSWSRSIHEQYDEPSSFRHFSSLPVLGIGEVRNKESEVRSSEVRSQEPEVRSNDLRDADSVPQTADDTALSGQQAEGLSLYGTVTDQAVLDDGAGCAEKSSDQAPGGDVSDLAALSGQSPEGTVPEDRGEISEDDDLAMITEPNFSPSSIIISQAMARSAEAGDGSISFTEEEIRILLSDPEFCEYRPRLAAQMRQFLAEIDSG